MNDGKFPGNTLQARREELGLSRLDVHDRIHVPVEYIAALEEGTFAALPVAAYTRGFLRTYCQFLDLPPEPFMDRLEVSTRPAAAGRYLKRRVDNAEERPRWLRDLLAWGAVCAVLVLGWLTYAVIVRPMAENTGARVEAGSPEATTTIHMEQGF